MRRIENDCCDCAVPAYPCIGNACPLRHASHIYCDVCGYEGEKMYTYDDADVCDECIIDYLIDKKVIQPADDYTV